MKINFTWRNITKSEVLENLLTDKLNKLERHSDHVIEIHVIFEMHNNHEYSIKATAHLPGAEVNAHANEEDMYKAIDRIADHLIRQAEERKRKMQDHRDHRNHRDDRSDIE